MFRKIRKLFLRPNEYCYDYFRKRLGFKKYFVTEKIRLLDSGNHHKWVKLLFTHPSLYLYYKFNKRLRKPAYPILVNYQVKTVQENFIGSDRGKSKALAVELENGNIIYFAEPEMVLKVLDGLEPNLSGYIFKLRFHGHENKVFIDAGVQFNQGFNVTFEGSNNCIYLGYGSVFHSDGLISFKGNSNIIRIGPYCRSGQHVQVLLMGNCNTIETKNSATFGHDTVIIHKENNNYSYFGSYASVSSNSNLCLKGDNAISYICDCVSLGTSNIQIGSGSIFFVSTRSSAGNNFRCFLFDAKNIIIGADCLIHQNVYLENGTGQAIYDAQSKERIYNSDSIIIGDHVCVNVNSYILKGVIIGGGSIIGIGSVVTESIQDRCLAVGSPAAVMHKNILWTNDVQENTLCIKQKNPDYFTDLKETGLDKLKKIDKISLDLDTNKKIDIINQIINENIFS